MANKRDSLTVKVEFEVQVPKQDWIEYLTQCSDMFRTNYCGYWMRGIEHTRDRGWLCWVHGNDEEPADFNVLKLTAIAAWRKGEALPAGFLRLDKAAAIRAYTEAVKRWGVRWMEGRHNDAVGYDMAIQLALLDETKYYF